MIPVLGMSPKVLGYRWAGMYAPDGFITEAQLAFLAVSWTLFVNVGKESATFYVEYKAQECIGQIKVTDA